MMESTSLLNFNCSAPRELADFTPVKPRLGKFLDLYSPEHLNLTPKHHRKLDRLPNENIKSLLTPEKYFKFNEKCRTVKPQQKFRNAWSNCSFEGNQSFPRISRRLRPIKMDLETPTKVKQAVDLVRVDGPNGLRFNTSLATGEVVGSPAQSQTDRLQQSINTTKAVFTIEPNSSKILIVNNKACSLLGYSSGELCDFRFTDLLRKRSSKTFKLHDAGDADISEDGTIILLSGKVVELVSKDGGSVQVSLWIRQLENDGPCLVVAEPVICKNVVLTIDADTGMILSCDGDDAAMLFQAESSEKLIGLPVASLIPSIQIPAYDAPIPKNVSKQKVTGRTLDGGSFPLCLWISKPNTIDSASWSSVKTTKEKPMFIVNVRARPIISKVYDFMKKEACNNYIPIIIP